MEVHAAAVAELESTAQAQQEELAALAGKVAMLFYTCAVELLTNGWHRVPHGCF